MTLLVQPCAPSSPYLVQISGAIGTAIAPGLTRAEATRLRDDLDAALNSASDGARGGDL